MATQTPTQPPSASKYYAISALLALQAAREALAARPQGMTRVAAVVLRYQMIASTLAERAVTTMLEDQGYDRPPLARINPTGFTTPAPAIVTKATQAATDAEFQRLVESMTQETARAVQQATIAAQADPIGWVRHLNLPSCSRCALLAGRYYRYSDGFLRHPGCDCVMVPAIDNDRSMTYDPEQLAREGKVTGLSKADLAALDEGADFGRVVNIRSKAAGLTVSGRVLERAGRLTPEGILREAGGDRAKALDLLTRAGYLR